MGVAATESARLLMHEPRKYAGLVAGLYLLSLKDCEVGKATKASYLFLRHIDDLLDESKQSDEKLPYVLTLRNEIISNTFTKNPKISTLVQYSLDILERKARPEDNPRQDFVSVIDAMVFDYKRAGERRVLPKEQLENYYHNTFFL